jgi:hypothetical protein
MGFMQKGRGLGRIVPEPRSLFGFALVAKKKKTHCCQPMSILTESKSSISLTPLLSVSGMLKGEAVMG